MAKNHDEPRWVKFGRWLREERLKIISPTSGRPISQDELAARSELSRGQITRIELGGSGTPPTTIRRIARALGRKTESEIEEVLRRAGYTSGREPFDLPLEMSRYPDLSEGGKLAVARLVDHLFTVEQEAKTKKRGK